MNFIFALLNFLYSCEHGLIDIHTSELKTNYFTRARKYDKKLYHISIKKHKMKGIILRSTEDDYKIKILTKENYIKSYYKKHKICQTNLENGETKILIQLVKVSFRSGIKSLI